MASAIWQFVLRPWPAEVAMPLGARVLSAGAQGDQIVVWASVKPSAAVGPRRFLAVPTGDSAPIADGWAFVGTVVMDDGLVFHIFDGGDVR